MRESTARIAAYDTIVLLIAATMTSGARRRLRAGRGAARSSAPPRCCARRRALQQLMTSGRKRTVPRGSGPAARRAGRARRSGDRSRLGAHCVLALHVYESDAAGATVRQPDHDDRSSTRSNKCLRRLRELSVVGRRRRAGPAPRDERAGFVVELVGGVALWGVRSSFSRSLDTCAQCPASEVPNQSSYGRWGETCIRAACHPVGGGQMRSSTHGSAARSGRSWFHDSREAEGAT
jgi:hypothetical protein